MEKIILTGASGFLGKNILIKISKVFKNSKIFAIHNKSKITYKAKNIFPLKVNLLNKNNYSVFPNSYNTLIHLAGRKNTFLDKKSGENQLFENIKITQLLAENAVKSNCKNIIFASSVYIYSGTEGTPFKEKIINIPNEHLGLSKFISEGIFKAGSINNLYSTISLRIFTTYGSDLGCPQFLNKAYRRIKENRISATFSNPNILRDFIHIEDVSESFLRALIYIQKKETGYFSSINIATGKSLSIKDVTSAIKKILNHNIKINFIDDERFKNDQDHISNIEKLKNLFRWNPKIEIYEGIKLIK